MKRYRYIFPPSTLQKRRIINFWWIQRKHYEGLSYFTIVFMPFPIWTVSVIMCGSVICIFVLSLHCTRITHGSLSSPTPPLTPAWQRRCLRNNHEKLIHVMAIFLNESRPNWEPHYSRTSEPIRSVRGEESGGYVFHMVRESAICYDSQVEEYAFWKQSSSLLSFRILQRYHELSAGCIFSKFWIFKRTNINIYFTSLYLHYHLRCKN